MCVCLRVHARNQLKLCIALSDDQSPPLVPDEDVKGAVPNRLRSRTSRKGIAGYEDSEDDDLFHVNNLKSLTPSAMHRTRRDRTQRRNTMACIPPSSLLTEGEDNSL